MGTEILESYVCFCSVLLIECLTFCRSVAIFDVVKSARRSSPFVLLQPRLLLRDVMSTTSRDYPDDETAFVGLVPETGSLFALGPDNFPLVAFSGPVSEEVVVIEDGKPQCYEGATDWRCQTGVRTLKADSASHIARLLDGVPSPGTPPLPSATGSDTRPGNTNSQAYPGNDQIVFGEGKARAVPWQWVSSVPESVVLGWAIWAPSSSALVFTLASMVGALLWFKKKLPQKAHVLAVPLTAISGNGVDHNETLVKEDHLSPESTNSSTDIPPSESPVVATSPSAIPMSPENTLPIPSKALLPTSRTPTIASVAASDPPATDDDDKPSPSKLESAEGAEDSGEVKKKPRKRRRRRKGEAKDASAEGGDEPENEDGEVGEGDNVAVSGAQSLIPPPMPVPHASPSLIVSETVLGTSLTHFAQEFDTD